jgi:uncharacterized protein (DUF305 family)
LAAQIKSAQGPEVELMKSFLTQWDEPVVDPGSMDHGAIEMARTVEQSGKNLEVQALAKTIISDQQVEIDQMKSMLANL